MVVTAEPTPIRKGVAVQPIHIAGKTLLQSITAPLKPTGTMHLQFRAEALRNSPAGVHGKASIYAVEGGDDVFVASDHFNIERSEDRKRLASSAWLRLGQAYRDAFGHEQEFAVLFDAFCVDAWPVSVSNISGGWVEPVAAIEPVETYTPFLVKDGGTIMFAPPGSAKTFLGLMVAYSVQYNVSDLFPVRPTTTLYVNLERSESSMARRLTMVTSALGIPSGSRLLMLNRRGASITDVEDAIADMVQRYHVGLVIVDSLSRFGGGSLNDDSVMNRAMDLLNRVAPTWLLIAHSPRADSSHAFGSVMQDAAADVMLQVASEDGGSGSLGVALTVTKSNDIPRGPVGTYALSFDREYGLTGIRPARAGEFVELEGAEEDRRPVKQRMVTFIERHGDATEEQMREALGVGRTSITKALADRNVFVKTRTQDRKAYYGLLAFHEEDPS